jgi:flagellar motor switch/type III secretory pathway protein FliN
LQNLEKNQNPLLAKKIKRKTLTHLEKFVPKFDLRLPVGSTTLDAESLLFLEPNDIVLLEKSDISLQDDSFRGKISIFIGNGENFSFKGKILDSEQNKLLNFKIEEILSEETRRRFTSAKFKMDEKDTELVEEKTEVEVNDEEISASLENLQVRIRVEIAGNKISLRELQNLRNGQIIALGCRPTDPVRLVTDSNDEPLAIGELVEIEGQLGVKLTKVFI